MCISEKVGNYRSTFTESSNSLKHDYCLVYKTRVVISPFICQNEANGDEVLAPARVRPGFGVQQRQPPLGRRVLSPVSDRAALGHFRPLFRSWGY
jgi:hypothetical protein